MLKARTLTLAISRPISDVYSYMANPANLPRWTMMEGGRPEPELGPDIWSFDGINGRVEMHLTPPNDFHILDYKIRQGGRVIQAVISDEFFASEAEWMMADLMALKSLLEP